MTNLRRGWVFAAVGLLIVGSVALSQGQRDEISPRVVVNNPTNYEQMFYLKNGVDGEFVEFRLPANDWAAYKNATYIRLWTNQTVHVDKPLERGRRYDIYLNGENLWDVYKP